MRARWLLATPLIDAATVLPSCGQLALQAWRDEPDASHGDQQARLGPPHEARRALVPEIFMDRGATLPNFALGAGLALANHELGRLALRRLTHPVTRELGHGGRARGPGTAGDREGRRMGAAHRRARR